LQPTISARLKERAVVGAGRPAHGSAVVWFLVLLTGVYGGYFGAAQGVLLLAVMGIGIGDDLQRLNAVKNVLAMLVNAVAGIIFIVRAPVDWVVVVLIAAGAVVGGTLGARIGRRIPPLAFRTFVVLVGVVAIVALVF
jgi:uncharacterized membrane protein YfcA